ncbi:cbb3-type cytochrome oxidase assembly protein CcoS [Thalassotalea sp. HSM 43]|uniref:cbb3-type cytochrome oxidase assembly protein CcoS n=1 Tax=Thalassotalea sp. HSM 43 TaxID=2552945 RepID=UPI001080241A|nr:cbb3-type cytochrome oxidase assembly protein CcoS [Thalassotalea sp. HSM 43]QBY05850.1 cbb3-type cytochrome oxidase assembly protein CcoS [Thalassotalea sp. HSM 43]
MSVIYILIPIAILFTAIAIYLFFWAVKSEQFDDLEKQGMSILFDEEKKQTPGQKRSQSQSHNKDAESHTDDKPNSSDN